jgi:TIR domain-containing protein
MAAPSEGSPGGSGAPDVFVSYSRADEAFVRRLDAALRARGKDVWVDWEDIPPTGAPGSTPASMRRAPSSRC